MVAAPVILLLVGALAGGPLDPRYQALGGPFDLRGLGGVTLVTTQLALAVITVGLVVAAGSLVRRFRHARGLERLQLRWVAWAATLVALVGVVVLLALATGAPGGAVLLGWAVGVCLAILPLAIGAAILRYRLYDLDRIISRTVAYGLLTILLAGVYAGLVLLLGLLFGDLGGRTPSWAVAGATLTVAALFQPARRRIQQAVDRRFNRRRYDAARTIQGFSARLRQQVDLDVLSTEMLAVVEQTMQPTQASLWLRPSHAASSATGRPGPLREPRRSGASRHGRSRLPVVDELERVQVTVA